jgi:hypothetical protein
VFDIVASKGPGDAVMLRALALHLRRNEWDVTVYTGWPDVFIGMDVAVKKDRTGEEDIRHCKACLHCRLPEVRMGTLFEMACRQAGVFDRVPLAIDWIPQNHELMRSILEAADGRKILMYQPPKIARGFEQEEMRPDPESFGAVLMRHSDYFRIKVGHPDSVDAGKYPCELDLFGKTTVRDVFDIGTIADRMFSDVSYLQILAQALDKFSVCMFTERARNSKFSRVRNMTPDMLFHKRELGRAVYAR